MPVWGTGTRARPSFPPLAGDIDADVCVVGLGGSGLACLGALADLAVRTPRIVGIDARVIAGGAAGRNGGFLLAGLAMFYHDAIARLGHERARSLYAATRAELDRMAAETPDVVRRTGSLRIAMSDDEMADCLRHEQALNDDGFSGERYAGAEGRGLLLPEDAVFDPAARCHVLARRLAERGVVLHEDTPAVAIDAGRVTTPHGTIRAPAIVVAVDGRLECLVPALRGRVRTARLQMLATAPASGARFTRPVYARYGMEYWQQLSDDRIVLGGFRDRGGDDEWTTDATPTVAIQVALESFLRRELRVTAPITHRWAASVGFTGSGIPVIEHVAPGVVAVGGYSGTGNVVGALAGRLAAQMVHGKEPPDLALFRDAVPPSPVAMRGREPDVEER